jgi:trehalose synthase-fused probable maltokinase
MTDKRLDISKLRSALPGAVPQFLLRQRWFGGKARTIRSAEVQDIVTLEDESIGFIAFLKVKYEDDQDEIYALPFQPASGDADGAVAEQSPEPRLELAAAGASRPITLRDALWERKFCVRLLRAIARGETLRGERGRVIARPSTALAGLWNPEQGDLDATVLRGEQSNTSVAYSNRLILKFFRKLEPGVNPDLEIGFFLTEKTSFTHIPRTAGSLEFQPPEGEPASLGILQEFIPNQGDAWKYTLAGLPAYFERVAGVDPKRARALLPSGSMLDNLDTVPPSEVRGWTGNYLEDAALLARRTAELHAALASDGSDPAFAPEPFTADDRAALIRGMRDLLERVFGLLKRRAPELDLRTRPRAEKALRMESVLRGRFQSLAEENLNFKRARIHGDYHLGQVLRTGGDFVIIDFEGEPARPLAERRAKRSPLQDVAGMVRSFHYAASAGLAEFLRKREGEPQAPEALEIFPRLWYTWVSSVFLNTYFKSSAGAVFLPHEWAPARLLIESFLLEKAVYELGYELNNRPDWVGLPLRGILDLIEQG